MGKACGKRKGEQNMGEFVKLDLDGLKALREINPMMMSYNVEFNRRKVRINPNFKGINCCIYTDRL